MSAQQLTAPRTERVARLANWAPWPLPNPSLIGHADVTFTGGWRINAIPIFRKTDGSFSAGVPNAAQLDREGRIKTDAAGKRQYAALLQFETAAARERWQRTVIAALAEGGIGPTREDSP